MLIPVLWTAIVSLLTGVAVYYNCTEEADEYQVGFFITILSIGWAGATLFLCLAAGM